MGIGDSDDKHKLELCNNPNVSVKREASDSSSDDLEDLRIQDGFDDKIYIKTDTINPSEDQRQISINELQIKHEVNSDPDIEVDLAYRIIDTFNPCEVKMFKREDEKISLDTKTLLKVGQTNIKQPQLKVDVDKKTDYEIINNLNVSENEKIEFVKENMDYDNLNLEDDVNQNPVHQLQIKGM